MITYFLRAAAFSAVPQIHRMLVTLSTTAHQDMHNCRRNTTCELVDACGLALVSTGPALTLLSCNGHDTLETLLAEQATFKLLMMLSMSDTTTAAATLFATILFATMNLDLN